MGGICECGCGGQTRVAKLNDHRYGHIKGQHVRFIFNHHLPEVGRRQKQRAKVTPDLYTIDSATHCWNWNGALNSQIPGQMYGRIRVGHYRKKLAHRWVYEKLKGPIPNGLELDHLCRNTMCVNPDHLEPVTGTENIRRSKVAKLTMKQVEEIRSAYSSGNFTQAQLALRFGVSISQIGLIVTGRSWKVA